MIKATTVIFASATIDS